MDFSSVELGRGENVEQMTVIADHHPWMTADQRKVFFNAVRQGSKTHLQDWAWKGCYVNSQQFVFYAYKNDREMSENLFYREGFARSSFGLVTQHAWLEWNGHILDLTYGYTENPEEAYDFYPYFTPTQERGLKIIRDLWVKTESIDTITYSGLLTEEESDRIRDVYRMSMSL